MAANTSYVVKPTAIYVNPVLGDYIDRESKALHIDLGTVVVAGVNVKAISTVAGDLPFIPDPWLQKWSGAAHGFSAPAGGNNTYAAVIVTESMHGGDGNMKPRILQLGLLANLTGQYVGVHFDTAPADRDDAISETPQGLQPVPAVGRTALPFESTRRFVRRAAMVPIRGSGYWRPASLYCLSQSRRGRCHRCNLGLLWPQYLDFRYACRNIQGLEC
jgi:hypothetical protein